MEIIIAHPPAGMRQPEPDIDDRRLEVVVKTGRIDETCDAAEAALLAGNAAFYARGDVLVRLATGVETPGVRRDPSLPTLVAVTPPMLLEAFEAAAVFRAFRKQRDGSFECVPVSCPPALPPVYLGRIGSWRVPPVRGVVGAPVLLDDGTLCRAGYEPATKVVVCAAGDWPRIPVKPTRGQAAKAADAVGVMLAGFPFVGEPDRSVAMAFMLSAVLRPSLPTSPGFAFTSPVRGSGKSKLGDVGAVIATGKPAPAISWTIRDEEQEKRIGAVMLAGDPLILFDNIEAPFRSALLCSATTQEETAIRILGKSQTVRVESRALFVATGNNLMIQGDLSRRFLVCNLDPRTERPELRRFDFDPVDYARKHRVELVTALLTIAKWGADAAHDLAPLGSFEVWSRRVRDPLVALGFADPCTCLDQLHREDPEREVAVELIREWRRLFAGQPTTVAEAIRGAQHDPAMRDALDAVAGSPGGLSAKRVGRYLLRIRDRVFGDYVLRQHRDLVSNCAAWAVESCTT